MFLLVARLPDNRYRAGTFTLYHAGGLTLLAGDCLGKADNERAAKEGNPSRDPILPYGDTPLGGYVPAKVVRFDPPHHRMGAIAIPLIGASGDALQARVRGKRTGLFIHGGRGDDRLVPTYGCLRLRDRDMAEIARLVGDSIVEVTIEAADESEVKAA